MLETAPSLSVYTNVGIEEQDEQNERDFVGNGDFSFIKSNMNLIKEEDDDLGEIIVGFEKKSDVEEGEPPPSPPMYLASGFGINDKFDGFREERENDEEYYRELLEEFPNHPLVLKKYAQFLQRNRDLQGAEEYYFRATIADPSDGETLSQYALLLWELHHDKERASGYLELATQTAPKDSNVLAAYAKFLWEVGDDEHEGSIQPDFGQEDLQKSIHLHPAGEIVVGIDGDNDNPNSEAGAPINSADLENYYRKMIKKNPLDPLFLRKYAQFLYQTKGDLRSAEEYYSHVILANPHDGEMMLQYAMLVWETHHDKEKTIFYMERAIEAAPGDSNTLAAYARFLWTIDE